MATSPPLLSLTRAGAQLLICWPDTALGYTLQATTNLASRVWNDVAAATNTLTVNPASPEQFFRLFKPTQ